MQDYENWTEDQLTALHSLWCEHSDKELALIIGRSSHSIRHKRCDLGLIRNVLRKRPKEVCQSTGPCPTPDEYYANWAEDVMEYVLRIKKKNGTYKEKPPCPLCNRTPCICRSVKSPLQISWI